MHSPAVVILGSYRRHFPGIAAAAESFRAHGCTVLVPTSAPVNPGEEFVRLEGDGDASEAEIVFSVLRAIDRADGVYFYNPDGYLGPSTAVELGYCLAAGKRFYLLSEPADPGHRAYVTAGRVASPARAAADVAG